MENHKVIGNKTKVIYFIGNAIACRRYINSNSIVKHTGKGRSEKTRSEFGFDEALQII